MTNDTDRARTQSLRRCLELADRLADADPVEIFHLAAAAMANPDDHSRARLVLRALGAHHLLDPEVSAVVEAVDAEQAAPRRTIRHDAAARNALVRLPYWVRRTGDHTADSVHLLLACLEADPSVLDAPALGLTTRTVVRAALEVRVEVSVHDRQYRMRGPILSSRRPDRPATYRFENPWRDHPATGMPNTLKSQMSSLDSAGSYVQSHLIQWYVWTAVALTAAAVASAGAILYTALTVTPWSLLWAPAYGRRDVVPLPISLLLTAGIAVVATALGVPWWLVLFALVFRAADVMEGRLALLQVMGDTADPQLRPSALRSDRFAGTFAKGRFDLRRVSGRVGLR